MKRNDKSTIRAVAGVMARLNLNCLLCWLQVYLWSLWFLW